VIRLRSEDPLALCVTDLASARIAEFDVEASRFRHSSRYMAPEAVVEASTAASDWWSLGIILLEALTDGACFDGVHERAFLLHLVARGIAIPDELSPRWRNLLEGLLTRNHENRWRADQALRWAEGESDIPTRREEAVAGAVGPTIALAGRTFASPEEFAFAAAQETNWAEARTALDSGRIASWLAAFENRTETLQNLRKIAADQRLRDLNEDFPLAIALAALNHDLPLCIRGEVVTPAYFRANPKVGAQLLERHAMPHLRRLKRGTDNWLVQLADRAARVRSRAKSANIELDENDFAIVQLAMSASRLAALCERRRALFPDSENRVLASLLDRRNPTDEDLLLLVTAVHANFRPAEEVLREAERMAAQAGVLEFTRDAAARDLLRPRQELAAELDARAPGFERCGRAAIDSWMDIYRAANRRMPLSRLLIVLSVPAADWAEPPHQDYVRNVLGFLERRVLAGIQKGPLIQMRATASVLDVTIFGDANLHGRILDNVVTRAANPLELARDALATEIVDRLRNLESKARTYHRDTGLSALYLAYPLLTFKQKSDTGEKTRIAPVFLWPIRANVQRGAAGTVSIGFDDSREIQLNPALDSVLGPDIAARWRDWANEALRDGFDGFAAVLRVAAELVDSPVAEKLSPMPKAKAISARSKLVLHASGAIFLAEFASQAIAADLRQLRQKPLEGTALEYLLRLREAGAPPRIGKVSHADRYATLEADPSQEEAVFRARYAPGLVVQGPPGTGKSQTIVNIVTDCMGRGERVLVVCEKRAALDVVQKRLAAEKLDHRVFRVENTTSDRKVVLDQLRAQVPPLLDVPTPAGGALHTRRRSIGSLLDSLEAELDAYHEALHAIDDRLGLSYRQVLSILAREDATAGDLSAPGVRSTVGPLGAAELESVIGECRGLIEVWVARGPCASALEIFRPFAADAALANKITKHLAALHAADEIRSRALAERRALDGPLRAINCSDPIALGAWLDEDGTALANISSVALARVGSWRSYFAADGAHRADGEAGRRRLAALIDKLDRLALSGPSRSVHPMMREWTAEELKILARSLPAFRRASGPLSFLDILGVARRSAARSVLVRRGVATDYAACLAQSGAADYEVKLLSYVNELREIGKLFGEEIDPLTERRAALTDARALADELNAFEEFAARLERAPAPNLWPHVEHLTSSAKAGAMSIKEHPLRKLLTALSVAKAVASSSASALSEARRLSSYLTEQAAAGIERSIATETLLPLAWPQVLAAAPALAFSQTFRLRHSLLTPPARAVFGELELLGERFRQGGAATAEDLVEALLRREATSYWKAQIETRNPRLQRIRTQLETDIAKLEAVDREIRRINRQVLAHVDGAQLGSVNQWAPVWVQGGVNQLRLRQVFERGRSLGLLELRPVWLVNPDVVSRMLPLEPGLFDVVVFDEASQMRVVNALPSLYRAKRAIVSGDEKQLPPTSFFGAKAEDADPMDDDDAHDAWATLDDEPAEDGVDAEAEPAALDPRQLAARERHIRDCEDLLTLASGLLPPASLDIHYRSVYRELIAFSNAAYYGAKLNIPVRRPPDDVKRARPIEIHRVDGLYKDQTNPDEASAIVELLAEKWSVDARPPTVGVVTFNMKQADLIEKRLRQRADEDRKFARLLDRERDRRADGEDVGFFVKNLENVQGDERDWIIFSTTFGRDENGVFRKTFGVLNQQGGERRLNVAVTRAKRKVTLVTSMPIPEISKFVGQRKPPTMARDYLQAYLRYAELVHEGEFDDASTLLGAFDHAPPFGVRLPEALTDDLVIQARNVLAANGYVVSVMPIEDVFSLDIAVTDPETGLYALGVEFDSPRHSLLRNARAREVWRPKVLERSGLRLHRIQSSAWAHDPAGERSRLLVAAREAMAKAGAA
jgi:primosomal replication protein N''